MEKEEDRKGLKRRDGRGKENIDKEEMLHIISMKPHPEGVSLFSFQL